MELLYYTLFFFGLGCLIYAIILGVLWPIELGNVALGIGVIGIVMTVLPTFGLYDWKINHS